MCDMQTAVTAHKALLLRTPVDLASLLFTHAEARECDRTTRQDRRLRAPAMRTAAGQRCFAYRATQLLNSLPEDGRDLGPAAFKRVVRQFLGR